MSQIKADTSELIHTSDKYLLWPEVWQSVSFLHGWQRPRPPQVSRWSRGFQPPAVCGDSRHSCSSPVLGGALRPIGWPRRRDGRRAPRRLSERWEHHPDRSAWRRCLPPDGACRWWGQWSGAEPRWGAGRSLQVLSRHSCGLSRPAKWYYIVKKHPLFSNLSTTVFRCLKYTIVSSLVYLQRRGGIGSRQVPVGGRCASSRRQRAGFCSRRVGAVSLPGRFPSPKEK